MRRELDELRGKIDELIAGIEKGKQENPRHALIDARRACEIICEHICVEKRLIKNSKSERPTLSTMIHLIASKSDIPQLIVQDMRTIQKYGNAAAHSDVAFQSEFAETSLRALSNLVRWYFKGNIKQAPTQKTPEPTTNKGTWLDKARETMKKPVFITGAASLMAGTLVALTKEIGKRR